jgi:TonB family protein
MAALAGAHAQKRSSEGFKMRISARFIVISLLFHGVLAMFGLPYYAHHRASSEKIVAVEVCDVANTGSCMGSGVDGKACAGKTKHVEGIGAASHATRYRAILRKEATGSISASRRHVKPEIERLRYVIPDTGFADASNRPHEVFAAADSAEPKGSGRARVDGAVDGSTDGLAGAVGLAGYGANKGAGKGGQGRYGAFGEAGGPGIVRLVRPVYPSIARRLNKNGKVVLAISIDEDGSLDGVKVESPAGYGFDEAAVDAVRMSRFTPATADGRPVACVARLTVRFELDRAGL